MRTDQVIDLSRRDHDPSLFWEAASPEDDMLLLEQGSFWILSTKEGIIVPPDYAAEVVAMDERIMEGRTHYAGFFDPGWGWRKSGRMGDTATMEVRPYENMFLRDGLPLAAFRFERMICRPDKLYGVGSHYGGQLGAGLAKFFAPFPVAV
jgi:dCTP deaminase